MAREGSTTGGEEIQVPLTLSTDEFVRRWCLHIQPYQLTKTRLYGGWSNTRRQTYMNRCRESLPPDPALQSQEPTTDGSASDSLPMHGDCQDSESRKCDHCGRGSLHLIREFVKPTWDQIFSIDSPTCPDWYRQWLVRKDREFWDNLMGDGFYEFYTEYLETQLESARKDLSPKQPPLIQLHLPGVAPTSHYELVSF